ncbi:unnamed protein product, partial [Ceratitis capitata]
KFQQPDTKLILPVAAAICHYLSVMFCNFVSSKLVRKFTYAPASASSLVLLLLRQCCKSNFYGQHKKMVASVLKHKHCMSVCMYLSIVL